MKVKSVTTTYKISLEELEFLFKEQLGDPNSSATINIDPSYKCVGYGPQEEEVFDGLSVTITEKR